MSEYTDDDDDDNVHEVFRGDRVHVLADKCSSCIFRSVNDGRIILDSGRVAGMVLFARENQSCIPCHATIRRDDVQPAVCRGFWDLPSRPFPLELANAMGIVEFDPPPPKE